MRLYKSTSTQTQTPDLNPVPQLYLSRLSLAATAPIPSTLVCLDSFHSFNFRALESPHSFNSFAFASPHSFPLRSRSHSPSLVAESCAVSSAMVKLAFGESDEAASADALKGALAEFISLFLFVFIGVGAVMSYEKIHPAGDLEASGLLVIAIAHGFALAILVAATANISGGHVNPAVSLGLALAGKITVVRLVLYWVAQLLGAVAGAWVLKQVTTGEDVARHAIGAGMTPLSAVLMEIILTFTLMFVVFATAVDPKKGTVGVIAPLAIGFTVLAQIFVGAPFSGASMNPGRSFGPALVAMDFTNHWVYWLGPFLGAALAAVVYDGVFMAPAETADHQPVSTVDF